MDRHLITSNRSSTITATGLVLMIGLAWAFALTGDWWMRFSWYRWQDTLVVKSLEVGQGAHESSYVMPAGKGGDLSKLLGIPSLARQYAVERLADTNWIDEYGYKNRPPTKDRDFTLVTVGDSFMENGALFDQLFFARLQQVSGRPVYNHALTGRGSFLGLVKFLNNDRFLSNPPQILVWGILEREVVGGYFAGLTSLIDRYVVNKTKEGSHVKSSIDWSRLSPTSLKKSLPNTSAIAQLSARAWNWARYWLFGKVHPSVILGEGHVAGHKMLFYADSVQSLQWDEQLRAVWQVADVIANVNEILKKRGIRLVVVLIPDKEQIYRELLPISGGASRTIYRSSCLIPLENELIARAVGVVNLLGPFRESAASDAILYWPDDTHWNEAGIDLAVQTLWAYLVNHP